MVVFNVVGLESSNIFAMNLPNIQQIAERGTYCPVTPVFPAVTSTVQASLLTGKYPNEHGIISNGTYERSNCSVSFWEQDSSLVKSPRIWDFLGEGVAGDVNSAVLFWQNTLHAKSDVVVTPKPIHLESRMIMWCYSRPPSFYEDALKPKLGEFQLATYWGPLASSKSTDWIAAATEVTFETQRPSILFTYFPHVDYSTQRFGKNSREVKEDLVKADNLVGGFIEKVRKLDLLDNTEFVILSEYPFSDVEGFINLNLLLRDEGFLQVRQIGGFEFIDFEYSDAFAMVDHQVAHIYVKKPTRIDQVKEYLVKIPGMDRVLSTVSEKHEFQIDHPKSGELIAISDKNKWFTYYWWYDPTLAPPFATTVDIHRKPGYDPVELFFDHHKKSIPLDASLVRSSHGRPLQLDSGNASSIFITSKKDERVESLLAKDSITSAELGSYLIESYT
ncbi:MAG: nucleotide pyrophosphatase/phosphodiesterase family protein [Nitrososphaeraceae archaeon]